VLFSFSGGLKIVGGEFDDGVCCGDLGVFFPLWSWLFSFDCFSVWLGSFEKLKSW